MAGVSADLSLDQERGRHFLQHIVGNLSAQGSDEVGTPEGGINQCAAFSGASHVESAEVKRQRGVQTRVGSAEIQCGKNQPQRIHVDSSAEIAHRQSAALLQSRAAESGAQDAVGVVGDGVQNQGNLTQTDVVRV